MHCERSIWVERGLMSQATISCPRCAAELPATARYCTDCGTRVAPREGAVTWAVAEPRYFGVVPGRRLIRALKVRLARAWAVMLGRLRLTREAVATWVATRRELFRLRREVHDLIADQTRAIYELGDASYRRDEPRAKKARARLEELDARIAENEQRMGAARKRMRSRIEQANLESGPTVIEER